MHMKDYVHCTMDQVKSYLEFSWVNLLSIYRHYNFCNKNMYIPVVPKIYLGLKFPKINGTCTWYAEGACMQKVLVAQDSVVLLL